MSLKNVQSWRCCGHWAVSRNSLGSEFHRNRKLSLWMINVLLGKDMYIHTDIHIKRLASSSITKNRHLHLLFTSMLYTYSGYRCEKGETWERMACRANEYRLVPSHSTQRPRRPARVTLDNNYIRRTWLVFFSTCIPADVQAMNVASYIIPVLQNLSRPSSVYSSVLASLYYFSFSPTISPLSGLPHPTSARCRSVSPKRVRGLRKRVAFIGAGDEWVTPPPQKKNKKKIGKNIFRANVV